MRDQRIQDLEEKVNSIQEQNKREKEASENEISRLKNKLEKLDKKFELKPVNTETPAKIQEEITVKNKLDVLIIGDSIIKHVDPEKINPGRRNKNICIPGGTLPDIRRALVAESKKNFIECLILNVGTNHLTFESPVSVSEQRANFCKEIRANLPDTRLLFSGILPKLYDEHSRGISFINNRLFKLSKEQSFKIIFHNKFYDANGYVNFDLLSKDRIHPNRHGVAVLGSTLKYFYYH